MKGPRSVPSATTRRPAEPFRPAPAARTATSHLALRVNRRRHRDLLRPR